MSSHSLSINETYTKMYYRKNYESRKSKHKNEIAYA